MAHPDQREEPRPGIPAPALTLGIAGLIPFFAASIGLWLTGADRQHDLAIALVAYGAVILSFLGGVRWGTAITSTQESPDWPSLSWSVMPSLIGWFALLLQLMVNHPLAILLLLIGFIIQYLRDRGAARDGLLPAWFGKLRLLLSSGACLALLLGLIRSLGS